MKLSTMTALRFDAFGDDARLGLVEVPAPAMPDGWAMIAVEAAGVDATDVDNLAGRVAGTEPPRIPGHAFAGEVVAGPPEWVGAQVWGAGADLGAARDGTHARYLALPAAALSRKPARLSYAEAAAAALVAGAAGDAAAAARVLDAARARFDAGAAPPPAIAGVYPLADGRAAYRAAAAGPRGAIVLVP